MRILTQCLLFFSWIFNGRVETEASLVWFCDRKKKNIRTGSRTLLPQILRTQSAKLLFLFCVSQFCEFYKKNFDTWFSFRVDFSFNPSGIFSEHFFGRFTSWYENKAFFLWGSKTRYLIVSLKMRHQVEIVIVP